jgi:hypothetical protein
VIERMTTLGGSKIPLPTYIASRQTRLPSCTGLSGLYGLWNFIVAKYTFPYNWTIPSKMESEDGSDQRDYNNSHRAFLQAFIARSVMTFEEAKPILAKILSIHGKFPLNSHSVSPISSDIKVFKGVSTKS